MYVNKHWHLDNLIGLIKEFGWGGKDSDLQWWRNFSRLEFGVLDIYLHSEVRNVNINLKHVNWQYFLKNCQRFKLFLTSLSFLASRSF